MDRAELKKRVRALLISSKQGCTPNNLLRDYKSVFGEGLPFHEFGYRSVVAMAEDMPDVVRIQHQGGGYGVMFRGVPDESTRHIAKMVSRQKNTGYHHLKVDQPVRKASTSPSVPFHIQGCLRQLMHAYPNGLPIEQFEEAYARRFGYYLSLRKMKCNTLQELVNNVPDVLKINRNSMGRIVIVEATGRSSSFNTVESENSSSSRPNRLLNHSHIFDEQYMRISDQLSNYDDASPSTEDQSKELKSQQTTNCSNTSGNAKLTDTPVAVPAPAKVAIPAKLRGNILQLLHAKHLGIWCTSLQEEYKNAFGYSLELGPFRNIMELLSNMKDVCVMEKPSINSGDWLVKSREQPVATVSVEEEAGPPDNFNLKEHISRLMQDFPTGILLNDLPTLFKVKYKFELPMEKLGFSSVATLVNSISDVIKKVIQSGQLLIVPVAKSTVTSAVTQSGTAHCNGGIENDNTMKAKEVLENDGATPVQKRKSLPSLPTEPIVPSEYTPPLLPQSTTTINVTVSHAITPGRFFIQIIGKEYSHSLNSLMITISNFYCSPTGVEKAIARPVLGQACCAVFDGDGCWYRAEIIGIPTPFTVLVKYVDYGNVCELPIGSIRKSLPEYLVLPTQAIECCLASVKPKERTWNNEACKMFQEAVNEKPLVAFVQQPFIQQSSHPLNILLCDTSTKDDVYIHELLISKGLAVSTVEPATPTSSNALFTQFTEQFLSFHQTRLIQQMLKQQLMITGQQLWQNGQVNGEEAVPSWQPQGLQSILPSSQGAQAPQPPVMATSNEHRKKMAAAKDIWSSDSETEDEKLELNGSENMTKQLQAKLERLTEERRNILERMRYNSSSGDISSWVEKLQNIEGIIKVTQESLKRRANGLPPLPPPGLSHMQPAKQPQAENQSSGIVKPKGVPTTNKPIIGLGRGKRFSKQNSLPNGISEITAASVPGVPVAETNSSPAVSNSNNKIPVQGQLMKAQLSSSNESFDQDQSRKQQQLTTSSDTFSLNNFLQSPSTSETFIWSQPKLTSSTNEVYGQSQLQQLMTNNNVNQDQSNSKRQKCITNGDEVFSLTHLLQHASSNNSFNQDQPKKQQLTTSSEVFGGSKLKQVVNGSELFNHNQPEQQQSADSSEVYGQNTVQQSASCRELFSHNQLLQKQYQMTSNSNTLDQTSSGMPIQKLLSTDDREQSQKHLDAVTSNQPLKIIEKTTNNQSNSAALVSDGIVRSFAKLSLSHNAVPFTPAAIATSTTPSSSPTIPIATSRVMSYSSAVMSQPPRKPPPLMRPQQQMTRTPLMHQPPPMMSALPHIYGPNQPHVVGLGRGVGPWSPGPPPPLNSWGGNGHYVHNMPPPVHFNFDHHHSPFYEIPSSGLPNPFYPIPPMGSSSGLDII